MFNLTLREIGERLPTNHGADAIAPYVGDGEHNVWRDSSLDLFQGLDVVELTVDLHLTE